MEYPGQVSCPFRNRHVAAEERVQRTEKGRFGSEISPNKFSVLFADLDSANLHILKLGDNSNHVSVNGVEVFASFQASY